MMNGHDDPKVTSIAAARKKADAAKKAARKSAGGHGPLTPRDWIVGGVLIAMALALLVIYGKAAVEWLMAVARRG